MAFLYRGTARCRADDIVAVQRRTMLPVLQFSVYRSPALQVPCVLGFCLKMDMDRFLPHPFQVTVDWLFHLSTVKGLIWATDSVVKSQWLGLTFDISTFCPHSVYMCFVWIWEQTAIISLCSINWLVCITKAECVYWAVRTGCLYIIHVNLFKCLTQSNKCKQCATTVVVCSIQSITDGLLAPTSEHLTSWTTGL